MVAGLIASCMPELVPERDVPCPPPPLGEGELLIARVSCNEMVPVGGAGTDEELWLANSRFRIILRHPAQALTLRDVGGGTVIDAAAGEGRDVFHEVVPIVGGGALRPDSMDIVSDGVRIAGPVVPLRAGERPTNERAEIRYRIAPDDPWLVMEGAQGVYVHPRLVDQEWNARVFRADRTLWAIEPSAEVQDEGGVLIARSTDRLLIDSLAGGWRTLAGPDAIRVDVRAPGADEITWFTDEQEIGRMPIIDEVELWLPPETTSLRAEGLGRAPTPRQPPAPRVVFELDPPSEIRLQARDARAATWVSEHQPVQTAALGPEATLLPVGSGRHELTVNGDQSYRPTTVTVELSPGQRRTVVVSPQPQFDATGWAQAGFDWPSDRSRDFRGSSEHASVLAAQAGLAYVVFAPEDLPARVTSAPHGLAFRNGMRLVGDGWVLSAWPWSNERHRALHGGILPSGLSPADALAAADDDAGRILRVDVGWLEQVDPSSRLAPDLVRLPAPGPEWGAWEPWFAWLDAFRSVVPTGPVTWAAVPLGSHPAAAEVERSMLVGNVVAGSGDLLLLHVDGHSPGSVVPPSPEHVVDLELRSARTYASLHLIDGNGVQWSHPATSASIRLIRPLTPGWIIAAAQGQDDGTWLTTGPLWIEGT